MCLNAKQRQRRPSAIGGQQRRSSQSPGMNSVESARRAQPIEDSARGQMPASGSAAQPQVKAAMLAGPISANASGAEAQNKSKPRGLPRAIHRRRNCVLVQDKGYRRPDAGGERRR